MQESCPGTSLRENLDRGVWPVSRHSANHYWSLTEAVQSALSSDPTATPSQLRILDIGAAFGDPLADFAQTLQSQFECQIETIALDVNPNAVRGVRQRDNAEIALQGMAQQLPLAADSVDIVIAKRLLAFLHPPDQSQSLRELARVLAPTGVAAIEVDPTGADSLATSYLWVLSAQTVCQLRSTTDEFRTYPFPFPSGKQPEADL